MSETSSNFFKFFSNSSQTCPKLFSNSSKLVQTLPNLSKVVQTCPNSSNFLPYVYWYEITCGFFITFVLQRSYKQIWILAPRIRAVTICIWQFVFMFFKKSFKKLFLLNTYIPDWLLQIFPLFSHSLRQLLQHFEKITWNHSSSPFVILFHFYHDQNNLNDGMD